MSTASIYSFAVLALVVVLGCTPRQPAGDEQRPEDMAQADSLRFDPLELESDLEVVPEKYAAAGVHGGETALGRTADAAGGPESGEAVDSIDALGSQVFKVQIFTSKLFGEARQAKRVAEEIFDQPVAMDYEVPYFKVRVGSFSDRYEAEKYSQRVRAAGYSDSWVVAATVGARRAAPLYDGGSEFPGDGDTTGSADTTEAGKD